MNLRVPRRHASRKGEQGYMLMALLLIMALMAIATATALTSIKFNLKRDQEEEMIHRGAQYARAIRAYYKKFGRYPATIENLENTNQMRFLRKRYKDPITKRDFRLLHFGEVKMAMSGMGGAPGLIPGASTINSNGTLSNNTNGGSSNSVFGNNNQKANQSSDSSNTSSDAQSTSDSSGNDSGNQGSSGPSGQTFGGLPIVGVASFSKDPGIREFDKKKKYSEWQFVYDPTLDRGILITTPYQPMQQMFGMAPQNVNGAQAPTPGLGTGAPGAPPQNPVSPTGPTLGNPPPTDTPNQQ